MCKAFSAHYFKYNKNYGVLISVLGNEENFNYLSFELMSTCVDYTNITLYI
jgi:hypothetical protein